MKKVACLVAFAMMFNSVAQADVIYVVDNNNVVTQRVITSPMTSQVVYSQPQQVVYTQTQPVYYNQPQQVVVQQPPVIVRETNVVRNYRYDPVATAAVAGITGLAIGGIIFGSHHHHHGGGHHGGWHHGGGHHHRR